MWSTLELLEASLVWRAAHVPSRYYNYATERFLQWRPTEGKRDIAIRVMVTAKEQAEIRKAANKAAMPMSVYVRAKALDAARA
jgi:hypothetical protein